MCKDCKFFSDVQRNLGEQQSPGFPLLFLLHEFGTRLKATPQVQKLLLGDVLISNVQQVKVRMWSGIQTVHNLDKK